MPANERISDLTVGSPPFDPLTLFETAIPDLTAPTGFSSRRAQYSDIAQVIISRGAVAAPSSALHLSLPAGFTLFRVEMTGIRFAAPDRLAAAVSFNSGASYLFDNVNNDAYGHVGRESLFTWPNTSQESVFGFSDALMDLSNLTNTFATPPDPLFGVDLVLTIFPGSSVELPRVQFCSTYAGTAASGSVATAQGVAFVSGPLATNPVAPGRISNIALQPFGSGASPSNNTMTALTYNLRGLV